MTRVSVTELRQHLPSYLQQVRNGEEIEITVHDQVIARLSPVEDQQEAAHQRLETLRGKGYIVGDIVSPIEEVEWTADADHL
ncbi:MAG: type II toxin-antitoxin system Phd/YefM family antitoxin [Gammaproteobacteria bacterium]